MILIQFGQSLQECAFNPWNETVASPTLLARMGMCHWESDMVGVLVCQVAPDYLTRGKVVLKDEAMAAFESYYVFSADCK